MASLDNTILANATFANAIICPTYNIISFHNLPVVEVPLPFPFSLPYSEFNEFLFAPIGTEGNGMPLSVVSALARLEIDPWQEAARLSDLPTERTAAALERLIRRLPAGGWDQTETRKIAARLIKLLPHRNAVARPNDAQSSRHKKTIPLAVIWLFVLALGAAALFLAH